MIYIYIKAKYNGTNNGEIKQSYRGLLDIKGLRSPNTISRGLKELENGDWIRRIHLGGLHRQDQTYELTGKFDGYISPRR